MIYYNRTYIEGYPFVDREFTWQYRGPVRLYEKYEYEVYGKRQWFYIMGKVVNLCIIFIGD